MQHCILQVFAQVYVHAVAAGLLHTFMHKLNETQTLAPLQDLIPTPYSIHSTTP